MNSSRHSRSARDMDDESPYTNVTNPDAHQTVTRMHASKRGMSLSSLHTHMTVGEEDSNNRGQESLVPLNAVQALQESRRTHLTMGQDESWHTQVTMGQDVFQDVAYDTCNLIHDDTSNLINHDTCNAMNDMSYQRHESPVHCNASHESRSSYGGRHTSTYNGSAVILHTLTHTNAPPSRNLTGTYVSGRCLASASQVSYSNTSAGPGNWYLDVTDHVVHHVLTSPRQLPTSPRLHRPQETVRERRTAIDTAPETHTWLSPPQQRTPPLQHDTMLSTHVRLSFAQQQSLHAALGIEEVREGGRSMSQSTSRTDMLHHFVDRQPHHWAIFNTLHYTPTKPISRCRHAKEEASTPLECLLTLPSQASVGRARRLFEDTDIRENTLGHY